MAGARKAILERGLAKVTARDIASAAGVSLAAIGYHFGSKDRLITEALTETMGTSVGDAFEAAIRTAGEGRSLAESAPFSWDGMVDAVLRHRDEILLSFENAVRIARSEESQQFMAETVDRAHVDLATTVSEVYPELSEAEAKAVAKLYFGVFQGIAVLSLIAPTGDLMDGNDFALAVKALAGR